MYYVHQYIFDSSFKLRKLSWCINWQCCLWMWESYRQDEQLLTLNVFVWTAKNSARKCRFGQPCCFLSSLPLLAQQHTWRNCFDFQFYVHCGEFRKIQLKYCSFVLSWCWSGQTIYRFPILVSNSPYIDFSMLQNIKHLQPSGNYMYRQFNIQQFYVLPTQCIYVFCVDLRTNSHYFPIQH